MIKGIKNGYRMNLMDLLGWYIYLDININIIIITGYITTNITIVNLYNNNIVYHLL